MKQKKTGVSFLIYKQENMQWIICRKHHSIWRYD